MTQSTIQIDIIEDIDGLIVSASSKRKINLKNQEAWSMIGGENAKWGTPKYLKPKDGPLNQEWIKSVSERIQRVCSNRPYHTKVRPLSTCNAGYATSWAVTVYWNKPKQKESSETHGKWILREYRKPTKRGKTLCEFEGTLECHGDDLYCELPDGDVPEGYDTFPDIGSVLVAPVYENLSELKPYWIFTFRPSRRKKH